MTTGDIKNNLRKLQAEIKGIKYEQDLDLENLAKGLPQAFLPLYHYAFIDYSRLVAEQIQAIGIELFGKTDQRFIESMYKVLRELYTYKPPINKDQFFSTSFAERKVIMCTEILHMVRMRHKSLAPRPKSKPPSSKFNMSANASMNNSTLVSRSLSAPHSKKESVKEKQTQKAASAATTNPSTTKSTVVATIVNEVKASGSTSQPVSITDLIPNEPSSTKLLPPPASKPKVMFEKKISSKPTFSPVHESTGQYNPAAYAEGAQSSGVEVINMDTGLPTSENVSSHSQRPIDMVPKTPARPSTSSATTIQEQHQSPTQTRDVQENLMYITQTIDKLCGRIGSLDQRLAHVESVMEGDKGCADKAAASLPDQITNIMARLTLAENRLLMVEHKSSTSSSRRTPGSEGPKSTFSKTTPVSSSAQSASPLNRDYTPGASGKALQTAQPKERKGDGSVVSGPSVSQDQTPSQQSRSRPPFIDGAAKDISPGVFSPSPEAQRTQAREFSQPLSPIAKETVIPPQVVPTEDTVHQERIPSDALSGAGDFSSSTPVENCTAEDLPATAGSETAREQIIRISQMIQNTEDMMNLQVEGSPVKTAP